MVKSLCTYLLILVPMISGAQDTAGFVVKEVVLPLNGTFYSPAYWLDKLVLCGTRKDRITRTLLDQDGNEPVDLYVLNSEGSSEMQRFDNQFRTDFHDGPISFDASGERCVVSRNLRTDKRFKSVQIEENRLGLFESVLQDGVWTTPTVFEFCDPSYTCTHPALSADGNTLVFASNMPNGQGGFDLWKVERLNDTWGIPVNLGDRINSSANEFFPTWIGNQLYFSANKHVFGGLDIYQVTGTGESTAIKILSQPLNGEKDDFGLISQSNGASGYFSSNRNGEDNLWSFTSNFPLFDECDSLVNDDFCYNLYEETAYELGGIESLVYEWSINGEKRYGYEIDYCFPGPGSYEIVVDIIDTIVKKTYANQANYWLELSFEEQPYISSPDTIQIGRSFSLDPTRTYLPSVVIGSYFWTLSDGTSYREKMPNHRFEAPGSYKITLGIVGTRDGDPFKDCSYKYILATTDDRVISPANERMTMAKLETEGEIVKSTPPKVDTENSVVRHSVEIARSFSDWAGPDEIHLLKDSFEVNKRFDSNDSIFVYSIGEWLTIGEAYETWKEVIALGYQEAKVNAYEKQLPQEYVVDRVFSFESIQFDLNKWDILPEAIPTLDSLVTVLKEFSNFNLLISAHTDDLGSDESNFHLSENRASAILDHFIRAGIDKNRLVSEGLGESKPIDTNSTPEGRKNNRRVEFKLIPSNPVEK